MAAIGFYKKKLEEQRKQQAIWDAETAESVKRGEEINKRLAKRKIARQKQAAVPPMEESRYQKNLRVHQEARKSRLVPGALGGLFDGNEVVPKLATQPNNNTSVVRIPGQAITQHDTPVANNIPELSQFSDPDAVNPYVAPTAAAKPDGSIFSGYDGLNVAEGIGHTVGKVYDTVHGGMVYANDIVEGAGSKIASMARSDIETAKDLYSGFTGSNGETTNVPEITEEQRQLFSGTEPGSVPIMSEDEVPETVVPETEPTAEETAGDDGIDANTSLNTESGAATKADGTPIITQPDLTNKGNEDFNKGIFDKVSDLFGDLLSAPDLRRMALYTLGGLLSGGSIEGSFAWAGKQVLQEKQSAAESEADLAAADLLFKRQKEVSKMGDDAAMDRLEITEAGKATKANAKLVSDGIVENNKVLAAESKRRTELPGKQRSNYIAAITGAQTNFTDKEGKPISLGERAPVIYDQWLSHIKKLNAGSGPESYIDISDPDIRGGFTLAVEQALESNRGAVANLTVPNAFFDMAVVRGVVSKKAGNQNIFKDNEGDPIDIRANQQLVKAIEGAVNAGLNRGDGVYNVASVSSDVFEAWEALGADKQDALNEAAANGRSGFVNFVVGTE